MFLLKSVFDEMEINAPNIKNAVALKQYEPKETLSSIMPVKRPAITAFSKEEKIAKPHKRGRARKGVAFFMLISIISLPLKIITAKNRRILIIKIIG